MILRIVGTSVSGSDVVNVNTSLLTCCSFSLSEIRSGRFPSWFVQDVQRIVDLGERRGEWAQTTDTANDGHMLVNQRGHALTLQITAVAIVTCQHKREFDLKFLFVHIQQWFPAWGLGSQNIC